MLSCLTITCLKFHTGLFDASKFHHWADILSCKCMRCFSHTHARTHTHTQIQQQLIVKITLCITTKQTSVTITIYIPVVSSKHNLQSSLASQTKTANGKNTITRIPISIITCNNFMFGNGSASHLNLARASLWSPCTTNNGLSLF